MRDGEYLGRISWCKPDMPWLARIEVYQNRDIPEEDLDFLGPTRHVFVKDLPNVLQNQIGQIVSFRIFKTPWDVPDDKDPFHADGRTIKAAGFLRVAACEEDEWNQIPPVFQSDNVPPNSAKELILDTTFGQRKGWVGPWKAEKGRWVPKYDFSLWFWDAEDHALTAEPLGTPVEWFVRPPSTHSAQKLDASDGPRLATWFEKLITGAFPMMMRELQEKYPSWQVDLANSLTERNESEEDLQRWGKLAGIFNSLKFTDNEVDYLLSRPEGVAALLKAVERRAEFVEAEAVRMAEEELIRLETATKKKGEELADLESRFRSLDDEYQNKLDQLAVVENHFLENWDRLVKDVAVIASVLPEGKRDEDLVRQPAVSPLPPVRLTNDAETDDEETFINVSLANTLKRLAPGATTDGGRKFHAALLACRGLRVPHSGWTRAYGEAVGAASVTTIVSARPVWASFDDCWHDGLDTFWRQALTDTERLYLVHLQNVDLSLIESWAMPLVNILLGHAAVLPVDNFPPWPENVRLTWCAAPGEDRFPLPEKFSAAFPAIPQPDVDSWLAPDASMICPGISFASFAAWARIRNSSTGERVVPDSAVRRWPDLAPTMNRDILAIRSHLLRLYEDYGQDNALATAMDLRLGHMADGKEPTSLS